MKINQKYLAEQLKVSRVTVTKALMDHPDISLDTRKKVKALADELGYIPNGVGRSLSTQKTNTIGIIVPKIDHSFFSKAIESMYSRASELGYQIILMVSFENEATEKQDIKTLISMNVDGIIIDTAAGRNGDHGFELIDKHRIPFLFLDRKFVDYEGEGVFFNDYQLSFELTSRLLSLGYRNFGYIAGPKHLSISKNRLEGFRAALKTQKLKVPKEYLLRSDMTEKSGYLGLKSLYEKTGSLPEVIVCVNDSVALGIYKACQELKIRIPEDLAVTGFGDLLVSRLVDPPLTTVNVPVEKAGKLVIEKLIGLIKKETGIVSEHLPGEIQIRKSVKEIKKQK